MLVITLSMLVIGMEYHGDHDMQRGMTEKMRYTAYIATIFSGDQHPPVVHHKRLVKDLLEKRDYDPRVRPVTHHNTPVNVTIRMNLYQIVDVVGRHSFLADIMN